MKIKASDWVKDSLRNPDQLVIGSERRWGLRLDEDDHYMVLCHKGNTTDSTIDNKVFSHEEINLLAPDEYVWVDQQSNIYHLFESELLKPSASRYMKGCEFSKLTALHRAVQFDQVLNTRSLSRDYILPFQHEYERPTVWEMLSHHVLSWDSTSLLISRKHKQQQGGFSPMERMCGIIARENQSA